MGTMDKDNITATGSVQGASQTPAEKGTTEHRLWGARQEEWAAFSKLALPDIRPIVSNPNIPTLASIKAGKPTRGGKTWLKVPSRKYTYSDIVSVSGFKGWPSYRTTEDDIRQWSIDADLGFGLVGNLVKAIDIDIDDPVLAQSVDDWLCRYMDADLPYRSRTNSPRKMLVYRLKDPEKGRSKIVVPMPEGTKGQVEFLFDKSFFVACGRHHTGALQTWTDLPERYEDLPVLDNDRIEDMINAFIAEFSPASSPVSSSLSSSVAVTDRQASQVDVEDDLYRFVLDSPWFNGIGPSGEVYVLCPWRESHTAKDGKADETVFFPKGLGGREHPGFKCMHTSHGPKNIADFTAAIGYVPEDFPVARITDPRPSLHLFERNKLGIAKASLINIINALRWLNGHEFSLRYDTFEDAMWVRTDARPWERVNDRHYADAAMKLYTLCQLDDPNINKLRQAFDVVSAENSIDTGRMWLEGTTWDGVDRTDALMRAMSVDDTPYSKACITYFMTAMAARLANDTGTGVQADMSLVLASRQGDNKSTFLKALSPRPEWYTTVDMASRDADTARLIRGKAIVELAELRGMMGREAEAIRAWMTATYDEYVKKYKEETTRNPRRCVFVGTTNHRRFLVDPTGNRRWLPLPVASFSSSGRHLDVEWVENNKAQIWAQGYALYKNGGIRWRQAQTLAQNEHDKYRQHSTNELMVLKWLTETNCTRFRTLDVLQACNIRVKYPQEIEAYLVSLGWREENGLWTISLY